MNQPLLGLVMIVKDEALTIESVLESYAPYIDCWTIVDTGSVDGTQDCIYRALENVPGELVEESFVDFSTTKNRALDLHGERSMFSIMPVGRLVGGVQLRDHLLKHRRMENPTDDTDTVAKEREEIDGYRIEVKPNYSKLPLVLRTAAKLRYRGRTHEYVDVDMRRIGETITGTHMVHDRSHRSIEQWRARWEKDLELLGHDVATGDARSWYYLGQTFECLGNYEGALNAYAIRSQIPGYFDETYLARYKLAKMMEKLERGWPEIMNAYLEAYRFDPRRAEPLYYIALRYERGNSPELARMFAMEAAVKVMPETDLSFSIEPEIYQAKAFELADRLNKAEIKIYDNAIKA